MASSEQTPPTSWLATPTPEQTPPTSWRAPPTPEQVSSTSEQAPPTSEQASTTSEQTPPTSDTVRHIDLTYKLIYERIRRGYSSQCSNPDDGISIRTDATSNLNPFLLNTNFVRCRAYFNWSGYRGDVSVNYDRREDTFYTVKSYGLNLQVRHGIHGTITETNIMSFRERTQDGELVENGGRYVRMDVKFATAAGSPARFAKVWGKRVIGNEASDTVTLNREEKLRFGIEGKERTWKSDN